MAMMKFNSFGITRIRMLANSEISGVRLKCMFIDFQSVLWEEASGSPRLSGD